jgi:4-amino-4-deoxy-L-arabinose transferase-like glycosyltransferase
MPQALPFRPTALLLALVAGLLLFRLGQVPLLGPDEPRYARVAIEMARAGEWVTPTLQGEPWLEKPPLYYWLAGFAFRLFGENEMAARLPAVVAAVGFVGATAFFGARLFGAAAGLHAGFALGTCVLVFGFGRAASMDMLLATSVSLAVGFFGLRILGLAGAQVLPAAYAAMGLATLAKGPLGVLLPALVIGGFTLVTRDLRVLRLVLSLRGMLVFLVVAGPWYASVYADQGRHFVDVFLLNHNVARFTSTVHKHPGPFYFYLPVLLLGLFPWSGLVPGALAQLKPRASRADAYLLVWLVFPLVFFSLAGSKLPGYVLPCLAPLGLMMGRAAAGIAADEDTGPAWAGRRTIAVVDLVVAALIASGPLVLARLGEPAWAGALPAGVWALLVALAFSHRIGRDGAGTLRLLRIGGAGLLLLVTIGLPPVLAARESGRRLFLPARGREVLVLGAWRTAWMAGYFYNDGRVREIRELREVRDAAALGEALVLCGPGERRQLEGLADLETFVLAEGPRGNALLRVARH